jgi:hypothetical protein
MYGDNEDVTKYSLLNFIWGSTLAKNVNVKVFTHDVMLFSYDNKMFSRLRIEFMPSVWKIPIGY